MGAAIMRPQPGRPPPVIQDGVIVTRGFGSFEEDDRYYTLKTQFVILRGTGRFEEMKALFRDTLPFYLIGVLFTHCFLPNYENFDFAMFLVNQSLSGLSIAVECLNKALTEKIILRLINHVRFPSSLWKLDAMAFMDVATLAKGFSLRRFRRSDQDFQTYVNRFVSLCMVGQVTSFFIYCVEHNPGLFMEMLSCELCNRIFLKAQPADRFQGLDICVFYSSELPSVRQYRQLGCNSILETLCKAKIIHEDSKNYYGQAVVFSAVYAAYRATVILDRVHYPETYPGELNSHIIDNGHGLLFLDACILIRKILVFAKYCPRIFIAGNERPLNPNNPDLVFHPIDENFRAWINRLFRMYMNDNAHWLNTCPVKHLMAFRTFLVIKRIISRCDFRISRGLIRSYCPPLRLVHLPMSPIEFIQVHILRFVQKNRADRLKAIYKLSSAVQHRLRANLKYLFLKDSPSYLKKPSPPITFIDLSSDQFCELVENSRPRSESGSASGSGAGSVAGSGSGAGSGA